jgi:hypothetical protein
MKLARVEHWRCGEPVGGLRGCSSTYVWVPDEMTEDEFTGLCETARESYLEIEDNWKKSAPVYAPPGYSPNVQGYPPGKTVAEIMAEYEDKVKAWKAYEEMRVASRQPFAWHLQQASGDRIRLFWQVEPEISVELDWGHRHGDTLDYGETDIGGNDYPPDESDDL